MNPLIPIFQKQVVQEIFQRVLYVWAVRHPGSGYVQGINDLLTPFFTVFLTEYTDKSSLFSMIFVYPIYNIYINIYALLFRCRLANS